MQLLPPRTGSLEDCAPKVVPVELPDIGDIGLAATGALLDETPPIPTPEYDTSAYAVAPANTGTLEDCAVEKAARRIGDISHLHLVEE